MDTIRDEDNMNMSHAVDVKVKEEIIFKFDSTIS